jgi:hypothetical protein
VLIGSPGVPVSKATALSQIAITFICAPGATRVWASVNRHDFVLLGHPLGTEPILPEFCAFFLASDMQGDQWWILVEPGLSNMADIALAKYQAVTPRFFL